MSNMEMLEKLSQGKNRVETVPLFIDGEKVAEYEMRPLTSGEVSKLKIIENKPYKMTMQIDAKGKRKGDAQEKLSDMDIGMGEFSEVQTKAMYTAIAWSLSVGGEKIPVEAIYDLDKGIPGLLFEKVIELSGLTAADLKAVKLFHAV